jgi:2-polyprenyl-3-methyl-5-hydroxy-6-metoxy-1,4-benzoquinol methylase
MDVTKYWMERGKGYRNEKHGIISRFKFNIQEKIIRKHLEKLTDIHNILEIGCGWGRITKILLDVFPEANIYAFDMSPDQIKAAQKYVGDQVHFEVMTIQEAYNKLVNKKYDLIFASEVFMHLPPDEFSIIENAFIQRTRNLVHVDWYAPKEAKEVGGYCWQHPYQGKVTPLGFRLRQAIFHVIT